MALVSQKQQKEREIPPFKQTKTNMETETKQLETETKQNMVTETQEKIDVTKYQAFLDYIKYVIKGYDIIQETVEEDSTDEYGVLRWVELENGWSGREHEVDSALRKELKTIQERISKDGFKIYEGYDNYENFENYWVYGEGKLLETVYFTEKSIRDALLK